MCYYLLFHIDCLSSALSVMSTGGRESCVATARCVLGDYLLDLSLLQMALSVEGSAIVGSVQPGLSASQVDRLSCSITDTNTGVLKMQAQKKDANAVEKHRIS